jgi:hypothetical protein
MCLAGETTVAAWGGDPSADLHQQEPEEIHEVVSYNYWLSLSTASFLELLVKFVECLLIDRITTCWTGSSYSICPESGPSDVVIPSGFDAELDDRCSSVASVSVR